MPLWQTYRKLMSLRTQENFANPTDQLKQKATEYYEELEKVRDPLRQKIWEYHMKMKNSTKEINKSHFEIPPKLTEFESINLENGKYTVRTHLEPLLYRSAIRNYKLAKKAREEYEKTKEDNYISTEIEYSLIAIVSSASCLESYINMIIGEYANQYKKLEDIKKKWKLVGKFLNNGNDVFDDEKKPFSDFVKVINWRNKALHYKSKFLPPIGEQSTVSKVYSYENAKFAIKIIKPMISKLCENSNCTIPNWIGKPGGSGGYWDETFHGLDFEL